MPRPKSLVPKLCIDKSRDRAFCKVDGKFISLGPAGSSEALAAYGNLLNDLPKRGADAAVQAAKRRESVPAEPNRGVLLGEVFLRFVTEELPKYAKAERRCIRGALSVANQLFGQTFAAEFGPLRLRTCRDEMVRKGWSRSFVNKQVKRLRLVIKWAVGWEMIPQTVADSLAAVKSLEAGESDAPESKPRQAIPAEHLEAVRPFLTERYRDIFDLLLATGARSGEIIGLTSGAIDRNGEIWRAEILKHKTRRHGKSRTLYFNARHN